MAGRKIGSLAQGVDESVAYQVQCEPAAVGSGRVVSGAGGG
jgi:hypothetical protein